MKKFKKIILRTLLYAICWRNVDKLNDIWAYDGNNVELRKEKKMEIRDCLKDELKRLNRMNELLEKKINQENAINNEPEQIVCNVKAMCEIVGILTVTL